MRLVVDASVAVKWLPVFQHEALVAEALALLQRWRQGAVELIAPDLLWTEVANAHWRAVRQNRCTRSHAQASFANLHGYGVPVFPAENFVDEALRIGLLYGRTAYDSLYVALAGNLNATLVTADEKLANSLAGSFPVKWLGAI